MLLAGLHCICMCMCISVRFMRSVQMTPSWFEQLSSVALVASHCCNNTPVTMSPNHRFALFRHGQKKISLQDSIYYSVVYLVCFPRQHYHITGHPLRFILLCTFVNHLSQLYLTTWDRISLEKLTDTHILQKFPAF
jgi:hypothetical protein